MLARRESRTPRSSPRAARAAVAAAVLLASCSVLPDASYPPFHDHHLAADFVVPADGRLRMPSSSPSLTIRELHFEPAPQGERFGRGGERWLLYAPGTAVRVHGRFRAYAGADGRLPGAAELLPGATRVHPLEGP